MNNWEYCKKCGRKLTYPELWNDTNICDDCRLGINQKVICPICNNIQKGYLTRNINNLKKNKCCKCQEIWIELENKEKYVLI